MPFIVLSVTLYRLYQFHSSPLFNSGTLLPILPKSPDGANSLPSVYSGSPNDSHALGLSGAGASGRLSSDGAGSRTTVSCSGGVVCSGAGVSVWVVFPPLELVDSDSEVEGDSSSTTGFSLERYWDATNPSPDSECSTLYQFPSSVKPVTWNWN